MQSKDFKIMYLTKYHIWLTDGVVIAVCAFDISFFYVGCIVEKIIFVNVQFTEGMQRVKFDTSVRCVILRSEVPGIFSAGP